MWSWNGTSTGYTVTTNKTFVASLGAKNDVPAQTYHFRITKALATDLKQNGEGSYVSMMVQACKKYGMKPICNYRKFCGTDAAALYIGQTGYLSHAKDKYIDNNVP